MAHNKNTRGNVIDYSILAGKTKPAPGKQNGRQKENAKLASTTDDLSDALVLNERGNIINIDTHDNLSVVDDTSNQLFDVEEKLKFQKKQDGILGTRV